MTDSEYIEKRNKYTEDYIVTNYNDYKLETIRTEDMFNNISLYNNLTIFFDDDSYSFSFLTTHTPRILKKIIRKEKLKRLCDI